MKKIFMFIAMAVVAVGVSFNASAQENGNRDENGKVVRGPYETNDAGSNWFISGGAGVSSFLGKDFSGKVGLATDVYVGKWFTPEVGARLGWNGLRNQTEYNDVTTKYWYNAVTGDLLWSLTNTFGGYKQDRVWNVTAYPEFAFMMANGGKVPGTDTEFGAGAGLTNSFKVSKHVSIDIDTKCLVTKNTFLSTADKNYCGFLPSATIGITYNFGRKGKTGFTRHSSVPVACSFAEYEVLKNHNQKLTDENNALRNENEDLKNRKPQIDTVTVTNTVTKNIATKVVTFPSDGYTLTTGDKEQLDVLAESLADTDTVVVTGSADSKTGTKSYNEALAQKRANAIKSYLVSKGVNESNVETKGVIDAYKDKRYSRSAIVVVK